MIEYIGQRSASDRYEAARKALARFDQILHPDTLEGEGAALAVRDALADFITPPGVGEGEADMVQTVIQNAPAHVSGKGILFQYDDLIAMVASAVRAGIQNAHESWECETAQRPSQEQMLRWLGLDCKDSTDDEGNPSIYIHGQHIEREEI